MPPERAIGAARRDESRALVEASGVTRWALSGYNSRLVGRSPESVINRGPAAFFAFPGGHYAWTVKASFCRR